MTVSDGLRAAFGLAVVLVVPGALVLVVARLELTVAQFVAAVPVCSLAVVFLTAEVATALGAPFGPPAVGVVLGLLGGLAYLRRKGRRRAVAPGEELGSEHGRIALLLLAAAIAVGCFTWVSGMVGHATVPPNGDASWHGFMIERIVRSESVDPGTVVTADGAGTEPATSYYPLGLHASLAIALLLNAALVLFAAGELPLGLFLLTRVLVRGEPLAAGFAAVVGMLLASFPYHPIVVGEIPLIVGMSLVPVTLVLIARALVGGSRAQLTVAALALFGLFALHNSEAVTAVVLGLLVAAGLPAAEELRRRLPGLAGRVAVVVGSVAVLSLPMLGSVFGGAVDRTGLRTARPGPVGPFVRELLTLGLNAPQRQVGLALVAVVGVLVAGLARYARTWAVAAAGVVLLASWTAASDDPVVHFLSLAWYHEPARVAYNLTFFVAVFAGIALATACTWAGRRLGARGLLAVAVGFGSVFVLAGPDAVAMTAKTVRGAYDLNGPVGPDEVAAFRYLGSHAPAGTTVLADDDADGSIWMAAFSGVTPVFGVWPDSQHLTRGERDRQYLRGHAGDIGADARVDALVRRFRVSYAYFGHDTYETWAHVMRLDALEAAPGLRPVFRRGGARVFLVTSPRLLR